MAADTNPATHLANLYDALDAAGHEPYMNFDCIEIRRSYDTAADIMVTTRGFRVDFINGPTDFVMGIAEVLGMLR